MHKPLPPHYLATFAFSLTFAVMLLGVAVTPPSLRPVTPILLFSAAYAWQIFAPTALPLFALFVLCFINDVIMGLPMGITPLLGLLLVWLAQREEKQIKRNFSSLWLYFAVHLALVMLALIVVLSLYEWHWVNWQPIVIQFVVTLLCYPPVQMGIVWFLKKMKVADDV